MQFLLTIFLRVKLLPGARYVPVNRAAALVHRLQTGFRRRAPQLDGEPFLGHPSGFLTRMARPLGECRALLPQAFRLRFGPCQPDSQILMDAVQLLDAPFARGGLPAECRGLLLPLCPFARGALDVFFVVLDIRGQDGAPAGLLGGMRFSVAQLAAQFLGGNLHLPQRLGQLFGLPIQRVLSTARLFQLIFTDGGVLPGFFAVPMQAFQ